VASRAADVRERGAFRFCFAGKGNTSIAAEEFCYKLKIIVVL
jgi:hypothetical protein